MDIYIAFFILEFYLELVLCSLAIPQLLLSLLEICNEFVPFPLCQCSSAEDIVLKVEVIRE